MLKFDRSGTSRITRKQYLVVFLIYMGVSMFGYMLLELTPVVGVLIGFGAQILWYFAMLERAHDCGNSWWYLCIPLYPFWLFFAPGEPGDNLYGPDPQAPVVEGKRPEASLG
jgi:uncharacterized membrane protein YhaH (DUF805 family)